MVLKFHFLCEGEQYKAEYTFISKVIDEFQTTEKFILKSANGKDNIEIEFLKMKIDFNRGDVFILFFDNIEMIRNRLVVDILSDIEKQCNELKVGFRYTTYYCFEELFLSYTNLLPMLNVDDDVRAEIIKVQNKIVSGKNYFREDISFWRDYFRHREGFLRTRESLSAGICNDILGRIKGAFYLQKSKIGSCWVSDCKDTKLHKNVCDNCKYKLKGCSFRDKLEDLDKNSVAASGLPLSTIFFAPKK